MSRQPRIGAASHPERGFSLVELLVVMAVLGVLAWMSMPMAEVTVQRSREVELRRALWEIRDALDAYRRAVEAGTVPRKTESGYPPTLLALLDADPGAAAGGRPAHFLRRIPRDPFAAPELPAEATWQLRAYATPSDKPAPGADVYDVSTRSNGVGLNGIALKAW